MFYYIDQLRTPIFPIGLVKTESDFIVRSAEAGLGVVLVPRSRIEVRPSAGKNTGVVLVPRSRIEVRPYSYFR